ncbi:MAG: response regulator [Puniceicoccaceae bacterium]
MEEQPPRILIVDDDLDFASLLSDVFSQASYEVETLGDPLKVEDRLKTRAFDLLVTDLRMPGIDGFELAAKAKALFPDLPVIMVSGFLDAKARDRMEAEGIVALYEKPLSVFSLLKNAARLIAERKAGARRPAGAGGSDSAGDRSGPGFPFSALPCVSQESRAFAEKIFRLRGRRTSLCVIAPPGVPVRAIAADICGWSSGKTSGAHILEPESRTRETIEDMVRTAVENGWESLTFCVPEVDQMEPARQKQLAKASRKGSFREIWQGSIRFVYFLGGEVETLYEEGVIGDELYLSMVGAEIRVPPLADCPEDIEALARAVEDEAGRPLQWEEETIAELRARDWPGNHAELRKVLLRLVKSNPDQPVSPADLLAITSEADAPAPVNRMAPERTLLEELEESRGSYLRALGDLLGGDPATVARVAGVSEELAGKILAPDGSFRAQSGRT